MNQADNPYQTPKAELAPRPTGKARSPFLAIATGFGIDVGGTFASSILISIVYGVFLGLSGVKPDDLAEELTSGLQHSWPFAIQLVIGLGFSIFGGYVGARMVKRAEYHFGTLQGALSAGLCLAMGQQGESQALYLGLTFATLAAVLIGAHLGRLSNQHKTG